VGRQVDDWPVFDPDSYPFQLDDRFFSSIGEALYGVFFFLMECPTDAGDDLEIAYGAGEGRAFLQVTRESFPGGRGRVSQARASSCGRMTAMTPSPMRAMAAKCFQRLDARDMDTA
jgi:hypothetical protein